MMDAIQHQYILWLLIHLHIAFNTRSPWSKGFLRSTECNCQVNYFFSFISSLLTSVERNSLFKGNNNVMVNSIISPKKGITFLSAFNFCHESFFLRGRGVVILFLCKSRCESFPQNMQSGSRVLVSLKWKEVNDSQDWDCGRNAVLPLAAGQQALLYNHYWGAKHLVKWHSA